MKKKKVLVTGGAGFIGGNFVQYMVGKYPEYDLKQELFKQFNGMLITRNGGSKLLTDNIRRILTSNYSL